MTGLLARLALDKADFIAVHALEGDELGGEVVAMDALLGSAAHLAWQQSVASAHLARGVGVSTLKFEINGSRRGNITI